MSAYDDIILGRASLKDYWPLNDASSPAQNLAPGESAVIAAGVNSPTFNSPLGAGTISLGVSCAKASSQAVRAASANGPNSTFSFEGWYKPASLPGFATLLNCGSLGQAGVAIFQDSSGYLQLWIWSAPSPVWQPGSSVTLPNDGSLHQWGYTQTGTTGKFYIDGALKATNTGLGSTPSGGNAVRMGTDSGGSNPADGIFAAYSSYTAVLDPSDFAASYAAGVAPAPTPTSDSSSPGVSLKVRGVDQQNNLLSRLQGRPVF